MKWFIKKLLLSSLFFFSFEWGYLQAKTTQVCETLENVSNYEQELFLTPGGKYTLEDIQANGGMTRSQKYKDFASTTQMHSKKGEAICPIKAKKAHTECVWIIGGKSYRFCSPSCIDKFLVLAKTTPEAILDPEYYVK
jgi:YHS domain-containing protein